MHETIFADAFRPPHFTVLLRPLLDYTIGHELILWQRRNSLVTYPAAASFKELPEKEKRRALAEAVDICCQEQAKSGEKWAKKTAALDLDAEIDQFYAYLAAGSQDLPTVKMPRPHGVPFHYFGAPELARLINYVTHAHAVMIATHFEGSPLNFPLGLARMLYLADAEAAGNVWVKNFQDVEDKKRFADFEKSNPESTLAVGEDAVQALAEKWNREHPATPAPLMRPSTLNPQPPAAPKSDVGGSTT